MNESTVLPWSEIWALGKWDFGSSRSCVWDSLYFAHFPGEKGDWAMSAAVWHINYTASIYDCCTYIAHIANSVRRMSVSWALRPRLLTAFRRVSVCVCVRGVGAAAMGCIVYWLVMAIIMIACLPAYLPADICFNHQALAWLFAGLTQIHMPGGQIFIFRI